MKRLPRLLVRVKVHTKPLQAASALPNTKYNATCMAK